MTAITVEARGPAARATRRAASGRVPRSPAPAQMPTSRRTQIPSLKPIDSAPVAPSTGSPTVRDTTQTAITAPLAAAMTASHRPEGRRNTAAASPLCTAATTRKKATWAGKPR